MVFGQSAIGTASWAALIAIQSAASYKFNADPLYMSAIALAWASPTLLFSPVIGRAIDSYGPRRVACIAAIANIVVSCAFVFVASLPVLFAVTLLAGGARAFAQTAIDSMPSHLADGVEPVTASIWLGFATSIPVVAGPIVAASALAVVGISGIFLINVGTYALGLVIILRLRTTRITLSSQGSDNRSAHTAGFRDALLVLGVTLAVWASYGAFSPLEVLYVRLVLNEPATSYAIIDVFFGAGLILATLVIRWKSWLLSQAYFLQFSVVLVGITECIYIGTNTFAIAIVGSTLWGIAVGLFGPACRVLILQRTPRSEHGRAMARWRAVQSFGGLIPPVASGAIASRVGIQPTLLGFASAVVVVGLFVAALERRRTGSTARTGDRQ
ncbi:MFS transporter [Nocardia sp. NPDC051570]|uniref:MFS transporter n=1 Tax=Nocardia sp. NPDC051570 TaxID=3364324 RepID=UPI0037A129FC